MKVFCYFLKIKRKHLFFFFQQFTLIWWDVSFLGKLRLRRILMNFTVIFRFLLFSHLDKELLGMRSDLSTCSSLNEILNFFPVFSIEFKAIEELFMLFFSPSASSSWLIVFECGHRDIFFSNRIWNYYDQI